MGYTITQIEDAIIATLKASAMNAYCKKIDSYQIEGGDLEEQIRLFSLQLPCVLVVYAGGDYSHPPGKRQEREMKFSLLACAQSLRGAGEPRRGTVGTYKILDDLRSILTGSRVGLDIDMLFPEKEEAEINTKSFSAYSITFGTKCRFTF
jgi:phage gp37-like protein